jgi:hypothetical protein
VYLEHWLLSSNQKEVSLPSQRRETRKPVDCVRAHDHLPHVGASFIAKVTSEEDEGRIALQRMRRALSLIRTKSQ